MRIPTGVERLDDLLKGGLPTSSATLLFGPAFMGKEVLARNVALANLAQGRPVVMVLTNRTCEEMRRELLAMSPQYQDAEDAGLVHFVDTYSLTIGAQDGFSGAVYLEGMIDLNALSVAVNRMQRDIVGSHDEHVIVIDSLSTLIAQTDAQTAFRFLQVFVGRTRLAGATHILLMDEGMHANAELQMFKHLASGMIALRDHNGKLQAQVQGLDVPSGQNWVEYRFNDKHFEITGSFAAGRIR